MILDIIKMGNPILYKKSKKVEDPTSLKIFNIINDMKETLESSDSNIGLAAPQVQVPLRIFIFRIPMSHKLYELTKEYNPKGIPLTVVINPEITVTDKKTSVEFEKCLSIPGLIGKVNRYHSIHYTYQDMEGKDHSCDAFGFHARVIQHEYDHLDGILYPFRMNNIKSLGFEEEILCT